MVTFQHYWWHEFELQFKQTECLIDMKKKSEKDVR